MSEQKEKELQKLLSFHKYIDVNHKRSPIKITIEFENKKFSDKGFAIIELPSSHFSVLDDIVKAMYQATWDKAVELTNVIRKENDSNRPD